MGAVIGVFTAGLAAAVSWNCSLMSRSILCWANSYYSLWNRMMPSRSADSVWAEFLSALIVDWRDVIWLSNSKVYW
jgi:hypothetical protein